jgi:hypothetical protein
MFLKGKESLKITKFINLTMNSKRFSAKLREHWWFIVCIFSIIFGGLLIKPAFRLLPIVLNLTSLKLEQGNAISGRTEDENPTVIQVDITHDYFLPFIIQNEPQTQINEQEKGLDTLIEAIDISPTGSQITIMIEPNKEVFNSGKPVKISFLPGQHCNYGDGNACIYHFLLSNQSKVIFASVHSGLGGEGEPLRNLIEGTGLNQGLYTSNQVNKIAQSLAESEVTVYQGNTEINGLVLTIIARIPPASLETYLTLPVEQTLTYAMELGLLNPEIFNSNMLVIETCGWQLPGDVQNLDYPNTTQSIYLGIIH